jgi:polar amino acid transport system permease protein
MSLSTDRRPSSADHAADHPPGPPLDAPPATREPDPLATARVVPLRHPWRWVASVVVLLLLAQVVRGFVDNPAYQWDAFGYWFFQPIILEGLVVTLKLTAWSAVIGFAAGIVLALMRLSKSPVLQAVSWTYVWIVRSIPLIVLLLFLANAGQREAAAALGLPRHRRFTRIVLPQAMRAILPSYANQLIGLLKGTSVVYITSLLDLFGQVETQASTNSGEVIPLLMVATVWYVILTSILSVFQYFVEQRFARGVDRLAGPTRGQRILSAVRTRRGVAR